MLSGNFNLTRFRNGCATPFQLKLNSKNLEIAASMIELFENSPSRKRFEIDEEIKSFYIQKVNPKVLQGLAKILFKRGCFSDFGDEDPQSVRKRLFTLSAGYWQKSARQTDNPVDHRHSILEKAGIKTRDAYRETDSWIFGDVSSNQKLESFETIQPDNLLHRFNIEQVQGLLLYSENLELKIALKNEQAFRQVMQMLKFYQLMFTVSETDENSLTLKVDGPGSILENSRSYGIEIANFFPAILLLKSSWQLSATLKIPSRHRKFKLELSDQNLYQTFYRNTGVWNHEKIQNLILRVNEKYADHLKAEPENRLIPLSRNRYLIPDIMMREKNGKRIILVEWFHYLSEAKLKQIARIAQEIPDNYVFAVKGKKSKLTKIINKLGSHLIVFSKELTAPALYKKFNDFMD